MDRKIGSTVVLLFLTLFSFGQPCTILSDTVVCLNDFITFQVQTTGSVSSYSWDLGDGKSSGLASPFVSYSSPGQKTIRVIVNYSGGGSCTATKVINAYPLPKSDFVTDPNNSYCLSRNRVCINDNSTAGTPGSSIVKRVVLFGDGYADIEFNPGGKKQVCHTYNSDNIYSIVVEVTDDKGCIARSTRDVTVIRDARALYGYQLFGNCDTAAICFFNLTNADSTDMSGWYWDFGDGVIDSTTWKQVCHEYRDSGSFSPTLIIRSKTGCADTFRQNNLINLNPIIFDVWKNKYEDCQGSLFEFEDRGPAKDQYFWYVRDTNDFISRPLGTGKKYSTTGLDIGKKYISVTVHRGNCISTFAFDSVLVRGPKAQATARNKSICVAGDSTYFCDQSDYRNSIGVKRIWDLGDKYCAACTTDTKNNVNVGMNCRYSRDENPIHLYTVDTCYVAKLYLHDTVTGCIDSTQVGVQVGPPKKETIKFTYQNMQACTGLPIVRAFNFSVTGNCYQYQINPDSAASKKFIKNLASYNYLSLSNPNGYVTVGLILETGPTDSSNCPGVTSGPVCRDTIWYHHFIHIIPEPTPDYTIDSKHGCAPLDVTFTIQDTADSNLVMMIWDWGDGQMDSIHLDTGSFPNSTFQHVYTKNGEYFPELIFINKRGCSNSSQRYITVGHKNRFEFDTDPCLNECLTFYDSTRYFGDSSLYWHFPGRSIQGLEKLWWDFGDGTGDTVTHPVKCFNDTGDYYITLITKDSSGCYDTNTAFLDIGGTLAGIRGKNDILCSEIVQFFDSSLLLDSSVMEGIDWWYWDFGDGTTPSYLQNPFHYYSSFGEFTVMLVIHTNRDCFDTVYKKVNVNGPLPSFDFVTDSIGCEPFEVVFKNTSSKVRNWIWYFGDSANTTLPTVHDSDVRYVYDKPGTYYIQLYGADSVFNPATLNNQYCAVTYPDTTLPGQIARKVVVLPIPEADFNMPDTVCRDKPFALVDNSDPRYTWYRWFPELHDSISGTSKVQLMSYPDTGLFWIDYKPLYTPGPQERGCYDSVRKPIYVVDLFADFDFDPKSTPLEKFFDNLSTGASRYNWDFGQPSSGNRNRSTLFEPSHLYHPETGFFTICLIASNAYGCVDTICKDVELTYETRIFIPNVFTPGNSNSPGYNDAFDIDIEGESEYGLRIYNRFGQLVFQSEQDGTGNDGVNWDGTLGDGSLAPAGVYYVIFEYKFLYTDAVQYTGTLTLIR